MALTKIGTDGVKDDANQDYAPRMSSTITAMEVAA